MINILLAEDDVDLNNILCTRLKQEGYIVYTTLNGLDALSVFCNKKIDLILSDIMMPLCSGYDLAKSVREENESIPILFMSAREDKPAKQMGYKIGIDDYITKPFDIDELLYKIKAIIRRLNISKTNELVIGNFCMNKEERTATINNHEINLSVREFDILFHLLSYPKKTFTRSNLMENFWDFDSSATSRTVDVYLSKLRDKTKDCNGFSIETVHGLGYKVVLK
ncbi:MAG: response regulator transcription factor [Anaeroplasmataceae bacterium]|nr:response regulator transcription factor [Anaeroplasmataceae bacterium]